MPSSSFPPMIDPSSLRSSIRQRRRQLSGSYRKQAARAAAMQAKRLPLFRQAHRIAFYRAADGELDPMPLLEEAISMGKRCYLPVLHPLGHQRLWFASWRPGEALHANHYGIPEPAWHSHTLIRPWAIDLVIMPLVAFDNEGNRMGMGAGYYDRTFAWRRHRRYWCRPLLAGYGYELQKIDRLEARPWDIPLDLIVTESRLYMR